MSPEEPLSFSSVTIYQIRPIPRVLVCGVTELCPIMIVTHLPLLPTLKDRAPHIIRTGLKER